MKYYVYVAERGAYDYIQGECDGISFSNLNEEEVGQLAKIVLKQGYSIEVTTEKEITKDKEG